MGIPEGQEITLTDNLDFFLSSLRKEYLGSQKFDINYNIDYTLLKKQEYLVSMQYKLAKTAYQPNLIAFLGVNTSAIRDSWNFFDSETGMVFLLKLGTISHRSHLEQREAGNMQ